MLTTDNFYSYFLTKAKGEQMCFEICPDLGAYLLNEFGNEKNHYFYQVPIDNIINTGDGILTFTAYPTYQDKVYAVSFDFTNQQLLELLKNNCPVVLTAEAERILSNKELIPERIKISDVPTLIDIKAKVGNPVQGMYEVYAPLIVDSMKLSNS